MKYKLLALAILFPALSHAEESTGDRIEIRPYKSGTNTLYVINGRPLERAEAIRKLRRVADFTADCKVIIATTGDISLRSLHSFAKEVKALGFSEHHCLLLHEDQSFSTVRFTPSNDPELWRPIQCVCGGCTKKESQQPDGAVTQETAPSAAP